MYPNPGAVNLLGGATGAAAFVGAKHVSVLSATGNKTPLTLSDISGIQPGDFAYIEQTSASSGAFISGGDGGWPAINYYWPTYYYCTSPFWKKLTAKDISSSVMENAYSGDAVIMVLIYRGPNAAALVSSFSGDPIQIPPYPPSSNSMGIISTAHSRDRFETLPGCFVSNPGGGVTAITSRLTASPGTSAFFTHAAADMLNKRPLEGRQIGWSSTPPPAPAYQLGFTIELRK